MIIKYIRQYEDHDDDDDDNYDNDWLIMFMIMTDYDYLVTI